MRLSYDRGTIVLEDPPATFAVAALPGVRWDPRVRVWRAPGLRHGDLRRALSASGIAFEDRVMRHAEAPAAWLPIVLRGYQETALAAWELAGRRGVVAIPTGGGKTRVALAAIQRTGLRALILVPTRALLQQWLGALKGWYAGPAGVLGDGERQVEAVTVATYESAWRHMATLGDRFDLLVVDEAHHMGQGPRDEALEMAPATARLGLTATPPRDDPALDRLGQLVGPVVYELGIGELAGSYLASYDVVHLHLALAADERATYDAEMAHLRAALVAFRREAPCASWADFVRHAARSSDGRRAIAAWRHTRALLALTRAKAEALRLLLGRHREARVLVYTADNRTAYLIAREHLVMPLTCDIGRQEREEVLARFRAGEIRALVSARVLNEGIDVPDADVAIIVGAAQGEREHVQRVGRLLRPAPGKRALVYELVTRGTFEVRQSRRRRLGLAARFAPPP